MLSIFAYNINTFLQKKKMKNFAKTIGSNFWWKVKTRIKNKTEPKNKTKPTNQTKSEQTPKKQTNKQKLSLPKPDSHTEA